MKSTKKLLLLLFICLVQINNVKAQIFSSKKISPKKDSVVMPISPRIVKPKAAQWETKTSFPGQHRSTAISFVINGKAYVGTGISGNTLFDDIWEYDFAADTWTQKANFPGGVRRSACAFSINGKGYITKGMDWNGAKDDIWEYDPATDSWVQKTANPANAVYGASCFVIDTKAYIYGGHQTDNSHRSDFWEYDILTDVWTLKLPSVNNSLDARRADAVGFSLNGKGYLISGERKETANNPFKCESVWEYNPQTNTWLIKSNFSTIGRINATGFVLNGKVYLIGGMQIINDLNDVWEYNPQNDSWIQKQNIGTIGRFAATAFASTTNGYVLFGNGSTELLKFK
jgi:N-acetylneuraminic acid mutarotase